MDSSPREPYRLSPEEHALRRARLRRATAGRRHSEETKRKISEARKNQEEAKQFSRCMKKAISEGDHELRQCEHLRGSVREGNEDGG